MKNIFKGFNEPTEDTLKEIWNSKSTLFVFDTNVLLNLYRYGEHTREDFFKVLNDIKNVWIPYHVGLEYQRNRIGVIKNEKKVFNDLKKYLDNIKKELNSNLVSDLKLNERLPSVDQEHNKFKKDILDKISEYQEFINSENKKQPEVRSGDKIRKELYKIFEGKVGNKPSDQLWLNKIYEEGEIRYKNNIPPGYKDKNKSNSDDNLFNYSNLDYKSQFGDLIIWKQIIEKANDVQIKNIIFISDDIKEDWKYIIESNGKKILGCRAELREEICLKSNIDNFSIIQSFELLKLNNKISTNKINENSIKEIKNTSETIIQKIINNKINTPSQLSILIDTINRANRVNNENNLFNNTPASWSDLLDTVNKINNPFYKLTELINNMNITNSSKVLNTLNKIQGLGNIDNLDNIQNLEKIDTLDNIQGLVNIDNIDNIDNLPKK